LKFNTKNTSILGGDRNMREKLRKLLNERRIPFLLPKNEMEFRKPIASGSFGIVELVRYQKKLYAHKRTRQNSNEQHNSILGEAIKLTDITDYHPNIQRLYFINLESLGFLMDYCDCGSLDRIVTNKDLTYTLVDALNWSYQLADALSFLHSKKISKFNFQSF
jgi:serine/threonine protein kinase